MEDDRTTPSADVTGSEAAHIEVEGLDVGEVTGHGYRTVMARTTQGTVELRHHGPVGAHAGVVWVGGIGGGFDTPGRDLYPTLAAELSRQGVASVRARFRYPGDLPDSLHDCLTGLWYLRHTGASELGVVGHSFGGAVVIQAAAADPSVRTVVTLSTQSYGADPVTRLGEGCSLLAVHGTDDPVLPVSCSRSLVARHDGEHRLVELPGAGHVMEEAADELERVVQAWLADHLVTPVEG